jgi:iron complex outermembrane receptor protein
VFPSIALAWKINEEPFLMNVKAISDFKLRLGYGVTGQQNIVGNDYPSQALYQYSTPGSGYLFDGSYIRTLRPQAYDQNIKWEQTTTQNIGLDLGFVNNRFTASFDLYKRTTDRLLEYVPIAIGSNYSNNVWTNVGSLQNEGYEITLNLVPISHKDMSLTIGLNLTYNQNKITKLTQNNDPTFSIPNAKADLSSGYLQVEKVGSPANSFFMNKQVYDPQGNPIEGAYVDLSGQGGAVYQNVKDMYIDHHPSPDYTMGISARFNWKNFDASASGRVSLGNYVYNYPAASTSYNELFTEGYWSNAPTYLSDTKFVVRQYASDYFVQNASFFKLDNASVGYNFNKIYDKLLLRLSFTAQNVFVITSYKGQDPEVGFNNGNYGLDQNYYPRARTYLLGLSLTY